MKVRRGRWPCVRSVFVVLLVVASGCISSSPAPAEDAEDAAPGLSFAPPLQVNPTGAGYEPSIRVGPEGWIYITAHKKEAVAEEDRLASWLWVSTDDGATWDDLPSPNQLHESLWALEGDLAIDDTGRLYFVDTYLADMTISTWMPGPGGPEWERTSPVVLTESLDDRPWLEAHGDGVLYLLANHGPDQPTPRSLLENGDPLQGDRMWFYASEDGGQSWARSTAFGGRWWCGLAASRVDDVTVHVICYGPGWLPGNIRENYLNEEFDYEVWSYVSHDRGATWDAEHIADYETRNGLLYPQAAEDAAGHVYYAWFDDDTGDGTSTRLKFARSFDDGWNVTDITPMGGSMQRLWMSAGADGHVAITFHATDFPQPDDSSLWRPYALVSRNAWADVPTWDLVRLDAQPVATGDGSPADFFQNAIGPDGRVHVSYHRNEGDSTGGPVLYTVSPVPYLFTG